MQSVWKKLFWLLSDWSSLKFVSSIKSHVLVFWFLFFSKIYSSWFVYFIYSEFIDIMECEICCSGLAIFSLRYLVLFGRKNCVYLLKMVAMPQLMKLQCLSIHNWPMLKGKMCQFKSNWPIWLVSFLKLNTLLFFDTLI